MTKIESNLKIEARAVWTALAERSGDSALERLDASKSGVALRLPPQSKLTASPLLCSSIAFLFLALFTSGCDWMPGKPKLADRWVPDTAVTNFHALYKTHCAACHASDRGTAAARPMDDSEYLAISNPTAVRNAVANGVPSTAMPAFAESLGGPLTEAQIDLIVTNIFEQWSQPQNIVGSKRPPYNAPLGNAKRGATAYQTYCAACHGIDGNGGEKGGSVVNPSYLALVSDQGLRTAVIVGRKDLGMPDWSSYVPGERMSDQEIADVVAWLVSHRTK